MFNMSLKSVFTTLAKKYDLLNRILTWRLDETWRETCAKQCASDGAIVDLCCGTGDLALHILRHGTPGTCVIGLDFSKAMLERVVDKKRVERRKRRPIYTRQEKMGGDRPYLSFILGMRRTFPSKKNALTA